MRQVIAKRMHASLQSTAQLTMTREVEMDRAVALRKELVDWSQPLGEPVPSYTDLVVAAAAAALPAHPSSTQPCTTTTSSCTSARHRRRPSPSRAD